MGEEITFHSLLASLKAELEAKGKHEEVLSHFQPTKPINEMFKYFWSLEETHKLLQFSLVPSDKSEMLADACRAEGNKFYQSNALEQALKLYNLSIMVAPHPGIGNIELENIDQINNNVSKDCDGINNQASKSLAFGFANRSAVLFELEQFQKCIGDIDLALKYGYPQKQQSKLIERKSKCLIALNNQKEALDLLNSAVTTLSDLDLDDKSKEASRLRLNKLLQECQQQGSSTKKASKQNSSAKSFEYIFSFTNPSPPKLSKENPNMPGASSKVKIKYTKEKGRYLVTDRTVMPGELLLVEKSYSCCPHVKRENLSTRCSNCLARCHNPLPCPNCAMAMFCSDQCRILGLQGFHRTECQALSTLASLNLGQNFCTLLFRMISQTPYSQMNEILIQSEKDQKQIDEEIKGLDDKGVFNTSDFKTVFNLVDNIENRSSEDLLKRATLAFILLQVLIKTEKYFVGPSGEIITLKEDEILLFGSALMSFVMKMPCNSMAVSELHMNSADYGDCTSEEVGSGIFPMSCLMNHSCNPSATHHSYGPYMATYASRYLPEGAEITISYGYHYTKDEPHERKLQLKKAYFFECQCEACEENWPTLENLSLKPNLINSNKLPKNELQKLWMQFKMAKENFIKSFENISKGTVGKSEMKSCSDLLVFLEKHVTIPCRMYFETQEALKHCIDRGSSCTYVSK